MDDLALDRTYSRGDKGKKVRLIQEWLCLRHHNVAVDGDFGPATQSAVKQFNNRSGLTEDGRVGKETFEALISPMRDALSPINIQGPNVGRAIVRYAKQHLKQDPREVGGNNKGPWVRLYMDHHEGDEWRWCAGFVCFVIKQACDTLEVEMPIVSSFSCDVLAASAKEQGLFKSGSDIANKAEIKPGSLFLNRRTLTDWNHTGIVIKAEDELFFTIEGNTNDTGTPEGNEVCQRTRGYADKGFVVF